MDIKLVYSSLVNFAMLQNHVPIVRKIVLTNNTDLDIRNIHVKIVVPDLSNEIERIVDLIPVNSTLEISNINLLISSKYLSELTERFSTIINIRISNDECEINSEDYPIDILAFDQWGGLSVLPEMLSAFITPNHLEITKIIHLASKILEKWTGSPSFNEYQSRNPDRVKKQMAAIFEAISDLGIVYCTPPASFEENGQRIRMCDTIISQKIGTCIDLSLLYASCLEAIGINPIIIIVQGHAFAGGWLVDNTFSDSINDDISLLTKRIAEGINEILLVETTCMNAGRNIDFDSAIATAESRLIDTNSFILFIDIKRSRFAGIRPIPQHINNINDLETINDQQIGRNNESPKVVEQDVFIEEGAKTEITKQRLWERKLLDLSLRNNLLNIRLTKSTIQIISVRLNNLEDALADGHEFQILSKPTDWDNDFMDAGIYQAINQTDPVIDLIKQELTQKRLHAYQTESELPNSLTNLYRSSRTSLEENGANTLYLALGLLKWYETDSSVRPRYAPILLLPVEIIRKSSQKSFVIRSREEDVLMNITLLEMLRQDFDINIGGLDVLPKDESGVDVKLIFNIIRKGIMNQKKWNVEEQAILGIFSFNKFIMWNDIHNNADKLRKNKIVNSLATGILGWDVNNNINDLIDQDSVLKPSDIALPISADSSQLEAICAATSGNSFILHGPPGTGKSQTITNIIANALYNGQKVLFVAEKMAALSVVQKRLESIGLAPFCLELHSNKAKKSSLLEQLKITTELVRYNSPEEFKSESERIHEIRNGLNDYVKALHTKTPCGYSLYEALSGYTQLSEIKSDFYFSSEVINNLTTTRLTKWSDLVDELQSIANLFNSISNHPLKEINCIQYSQSLKGEIKEQLIHYVNVLDECQLKTTICLSIVNNEIQCELKKQFEILNDLANFFIKKPILQSNLLLEDDIPVVVSYIYDIIPHGVTRDKLKSTLLTYFQETIISINAVSLLQDWEISESIWFLPRLLKQNKISKTLKKHSLASKIAKSEIKNLLINIIAYQTEQKLISENSSSLSKLLGHLWKNGECNWDSVKKCCESVIWLNEKLLSLTENIQLASKIKQAIAGNLSQGVDAFLSLNKIKLEEYIEIFDQHNLIFVDVSSKLAIDEKNNVSGNWLDHNKKNALKWIDNIELFKDWCSWNNLNRNACSLGLTNFLADVTNGSIHVDQIVGAFDKAIFKGIINSVIDAEPILSNFNGKLFEEKINKFKLLSTKFEELIKEELVAKLASNIPSFVREASQSSDVGILQRNIRNNGRGTSIRKLFDSISTLIMRMTPCMLMSPMSVAQYLDPENIKFDLVVFDEASQMPTCEAVGAISRGNNVIVVGDPKQMPPTNFFSTNNLDEENLDKEDLESILDDCLALSMPEKYLLWHYRSKHESLIAFSNSQYYDNKLLTFPSPDDIQSKVTFEHIEGFYDKGKSRQNKAEAEAIVNEIIGRLSNEKLNKRSIGVVTFSSTQQIMIEDLLNEALAKNPVLEAIALESSEPIFVKNLENVQGDERDIILFSIGYGPDKEGKISLNFGPLNREGGWRRLNVAVSRARYEMKVFSTLKGEQINLARTSSEGVAGLKAFLEFAEKGKQAISYNSYSQKASKDKFVNIVALELQNLGFDVHTNIGCSGYRIDIGIVNPQKSTEYILCILCDGDNYKAARTAKDREIIQRDVLKMLGWNVYRIWALDWWENKEQVINGITNFISKTVDSIENKPEPILDPSEESTIGKTISIIEKTFKNNDRIIPNDISSSYCIPYQLVKLEITGWGTEEFLNPVNRNLVENQIRLTIQAEGPISQDQLCRRVLDSWGISRIGSRIDYYFNTLFKKLDFQYTHAGKERYYWNEDQNPLAHMNYRVNNSIATDIAPEEVSVAVKEILEQQISLPKEEIIRETARLFNYTRLGNIVELSMKRGIDIAISRGFAKEENGKISIN